MSLLKKLFVLLAAIILISLVSVLIRSILTTDESLGDSTDTETSSLLVEKITIQEKYEKGDLTIFGSVVTNNPCNGLIISSEKIVDNTYEIFIETQEDDGPPCDDLITDQLFEYTLQAPEDSVLVGFFNGNPIEFNRIKLGEGQEFSNPIDYTKG